MQTIRSQEKNEMIGFVAMGLTGLLNEDARTNGEESGTIWLCQIAVVMGKCARGGPKIVVTE